MDTLGGKGLRSEFSRQAKFFKLSHMDTLGGKGLISLNCCQPIFFSQGPSSLYDSSRTTAMPLDSPPTFTKNLPAMLVKPAGNVAELKCPAKGHDLVTTWKKVSRGPEARAGERSCR